MLYLLVALPLLAIASRPEFDNTLTSAPTVSCDRGSMTLDISSTHGAPSVVFAKGHFNKDGCSFRNATHVTFDFEKCNVRRKREINPRRMVYSTTVVVQLHPLFITKVDRAYAVSCNYMEVEKNVGAGITVNELTTQLLSTEREQPTCSYSLKKDSPNGPNLKFAQVGDSIYHVWECPSEIYSMLIHSCVVQDGQGQEQKVLDQNGCSTDTYLMPELVYSKDLTKTFTASDAFNFPDVTSVQFSCQIKLCFKGDEGCSGITPPRCGASAVNVEQSEEASNEESIHDLEKEGFLSTPPTPLIHDPIFGLITDDKSTKSETSVSKATTQQTTETPTTSTTTEQTTTTEEPTTTQEPETTTEEPTTTATIEILSTAVPENRTHFPTPKSLRQFIKDKYGSSVEGSGLDEEIVEREQRIKRRDTDTLDMDISSPELTILEKELVNGGTPPTALSSLAPLNDSVCVPITAFWLLIGLVLLSLSFILAAIYKASAKQGFVQF